MQEKKKLIVVGTTTPLGNFILKYPIRMMLILLFIGVGAVFLSGADATHLLRAVWIQLVFYIPILLLVYLMGGKWCYKIEIDKVNNLIRFYRLFNRGVHTFLLDNTVTVVISSYCHIYIADFEFILHVDYIHDFVSYFLPKDIIIKYEEGIGESKKEIWDNNRPLRPGSKIKD